jgi:hypothetical protein
MPQILLGVEEHIWKDFASSGRTHLEVWEIEMCLKIKDNHLETMSVFVHVEHTFFFSFLFFSFWSKITKTGEAF